MATFNAIVSAIFDVLLAPLGHDVPEFDLLLWPVLMGVGALPVYKAISNQRAIAAVKRQISMHLLEIRLFNADIARVLSATARIVLKNVVYIAHNGLPVAVLIGPMLVIMTQLVAHYGYAPAQVGDVQVLSVELAPGAGKVSLEVPSGVVLETPVVRTAEGKAFCRLRAESEGDHVLKVRVDEQVFEKRWAVGGEARKVPVKRLQGWEALLYAGEDAIPRGAAVRSIALPTPTRQLDFFPDGELGILTWAMVVSLIAGFAFKGKFGVVL